MLAESVCRRLCWRKLNPKKGSNGWFSGSVAVCWSSRCLALGAQAEGLFSWRMGTEGSDEGQGWVVVG